MRLVAASLAAPDLFVNIRFGPRHNVFATSPRTDTGLGI